MPLLKEFREFALKGSVVDLAIGVIVGGIFGKIVDSLVKDVIMPPISLLGNADFSNWFLVLREGPAGAPYATLQAAKDAGAVTLNYGSLFTVVLNFLIISLVLFLVVRAVNQLRRTAEEEKPAPPPPPTPTRTEELLVEIRDALKKSGA